jgi:hypothetical protein
MIDAKGGEMRRLAAIVPQDWSADGQWLVQSDRGLLLLVAAESGAEWPVQHDLTGCYWAVWTNRLGE